MPLPTPGDRAPTFSLPNQHGLPTALENFRGHFLVVWWYPKADTPG